MYPMKKVYVLGQAMPRSEPSRPFGRTYLYKWLAEAGITETQIEQGFAFGALVGYFPGSRNGSHLVPTPAQISEERPALLSGSAG